MAGVKICGLTSEEAVAASRGADFIGFVFYPPSPRNLAPARAAKLAALSEAASVAVTVDPDDALLERVFRDFSPDYLQLHGMESPQRVLEIKARYAVPVIKAFRVAQAADIESTHAYEDVADYFLFDAKVRAPRKDGDAALPGGNGVAFDWTLLRGQIFTRPWFLSGGLGVGNVAEAIHASGAAAVDASSLLESSPGVKDPEKVRAFVRHVKAILP